MNDLYSLEIDKLDVMLTQEGIEHDKGPLHGGCAIYVPNREARMWDAVCHHTSYGHESGLLEIMGECLITYDELKYDTVVGYLTAEDVMERVHNMAKIKEEKEAAEKCDNWWNDLTLYEKRHVFDLMEVEE